MRGLVGRGKGSAAVGHVRVGTHAHAADERPPSPPFRIANVRVSGKSNLGFQSVQVVNEDSGYYATISVDDPQRISRVGAGEDSVQEFLHGGRGVRFVRPKRDQRHPESYVMFFVWLVLYCIIIGTRRATRATFRRERTL